MDYMVLARKNCIRNGERNLERRIVQGKYIRVFRKYPVPGKNTGSTIEYIFVYWQLAYRKPALVKLFQVNFPYAPESW